MSAKKLLIAALCALPVAMPLSLHAEDLTQPTNPIPLRWVVNMPNAQTAGLLNTVQQAMGVPVNMVRPMLQPNSYVIEMQRLPVLGSLQSFQAVFSALNALPGVQFASPDIELKQTAVAPPNDSVYSTNQASYLHNGGYAALRMQDVWEQTRGNSSVVIAVLDSGVLFDNAELKGRLLPGYDFVSEVSPPTGNRESGTVRVVGSNDGDGPDPDPSDPGDAPPSGFACSAGGGAFNSTWHGTSVAAVAAAQSNNGQFITGMDWNAKILPVRVSGRCGIARISDIVDGIYWAAGSERPDFDFDFGPKPKLNPDPADVINISFASNTPQPGGVCSSSDTVSKAIADARARNVSVVISAGNNSGGAVQYPANCPGSIAVGAAQQNGQLAAYSAKGSGTGFLTIHAAGDANGFYASVTNVGMSTPAANGASAALFVGTSFATPLVAATISLMKAVRPSLTPSQIDTLLRNTALPYAANADFSGTSQQPLRRNCSATSCGLGLLNPLGAINAARDVANPLANPLPVANVPQSAVVGDNLPYTIDARLSSNSAGGPTNLTYRWQQVFGLPVTLAGAESSVLQVQSGLSGNVAEFALTVTDTTTNRSNTSVVRLVSNRANERTFTSGTEPGQGNSSGVTTRPGEPPSIGGGGGAFGPYGLLALWAVLRRWRSSPAVLTKA